MWEILREKPEAAKNLSLQRTIKHEYTVAMPNPTEKIELYFLKLREFQHELECSPEAISDAEIVSKVITTLPKTWATQKAIYANDLDVTLVQLEKALTNYQRANPEDFGSVALVTGMRRGRGRGRGFRGRGRGRGSGSRNTSGNRISKEVECWYCLKKGHYRSNCPERKQKESGKDAETKKENVSKSLVTSDRVTELSDSDTEMACVVTHYLNDSSEWFFDSGASSHMCGDRKSFYSLKRLPNTRPVSIGDNSKLEATGMGTVHVDEKITLDDVLYVPELVFNLISVSALTSIGYKATFMEMICEVTHHGKVIITAKRHGNLYRVISGDAAKIVSTQPETEKSKRTVAKPLSLWHARLGHLNLASVQRLSKIAHGIEIDSREAPPEVCPACLEGKQHRKYNRNSPSTRAKEKLELVHSDSCGPFRTRSISGARYFILFVDDHTRMVWCYFLKQKNSKEVLEAFKEFKALCEKHSGKFILRFRCDNGRAEYNNHDFQTFLKVEGITYEPSAPYTQDQNGLSERMIRTLVEKARTMLLEAKLPERFWAEAVNTAVFLHNRSPTRALEGKTPFEAWNGLKPDLSHLRRFGCDAYLHVPEEARTKLQSKSQKCIFLGYVFNTTSMWRLWNIKGQRVIKGANVKFDESGNGERLPEQIFQVDSVFLDENERRQLETDTPGNTGNGSAMVPENPEDPERKGTPPEALQGLPEVPKVVIRVENHKDDYPRLEDRKPQIYHDPDELEDIAADHGMPQTELRRSTRARKPVARFPANISNLASTSLNGEEEPTTLEEALELEPVKCREAILDKLKSHEKNGTWELASLPDGLKAISCKWVFKIKTNPNGSIRHKARLVIREYEQREGIDLQETFAPVAKFATIRVILAIATFYDWEVEQMDVKTAFLYPELEEEVYMELPEGFRKFTKNAGSTTGVVARLKKTLYGRRQSPKEW